MIFLLRKTSNLGQIAFRILEFSQNAPTLNELKPVFLKRII